MSFTSSISPVVCDPIAPETLPSTTKLNKNSMLQNRSCIKETTKRLSFPRYKTRKKDNIFIFFFEEVMLGLLLAVPSTCVNFCWKNYVSSALEECDKRIFFLLNSGPLAARCCAGLPAVSRLRSPFYRALTKFRDQLGFFLVSVVFCFIEICSPFFGNVLNIYFHHMCLYEIIYFLITTIQRVRQRRNERNRHREKKRVREIYIEREREETENERKEIQEIQKTERDGERR